MLREQTRMYGPSKFKLGLFGMNCSNGMTMTKAPERWDHSWRNNVIAAKLADDAGLEFILPIGRWNGYKGETDTEGSSYETLTWASGLLAATKDICVFGTLHVAFVNPLFAAKQIVTADHIGEGRFGLNIVSGYNRGEFDMFGIELLDHDIRYDYTEEWVTIVKKIWSEDGAVRLRRQMVQAARGRGQAEAVGQQLPAAGQRRLVDGRPRVRGAPRRLPVHLIREPRHARRRAWRGCARSRRTAGATCRSSAAGTRWRGRPARRPTTTTTTSFTSRGTGRRRSNLARIRQSGPGRKDWANIKDRIISGLGTYPVVGSYDEVANAFKVMTDAGLDGMAIGLINYIDEFPHIRDEVLPRMERMGIREARKRAAA